MLHDAGAPEPWAHPDGCDNLAWSINLVAEDTANPDPGGYDAAASRVQEAIETLRHDLPVLADFNRRIAAHPWGGPFRYFLTEADHTTVRRTALDQAWRMRRLHRALHPVLHLSTARLELYRLGGWKPLDPKRRSPKDAVSKRHVMRLFNAYCATVGHGSVEAQGNAAKFIAEALGRAGCFGRGGKPHTPGAVSAALKRAGVATRTR